jgi:hypothetical protein
MAKESRPQRLFCNTCLQHNNHLIVCEYTISDENEDAGISWGATHSLLRCGGCDTPTIKSVSWCSEDNGEKLVVIIPPRKTEEERVPKRFKDVPFGSPLESVYRQAITAFNQKIYTLAGAGVRLVIEGVCRDKGIEKGRLKDKNGDFVKNKNGDIVESDALVGRINGLEEKGLVTGEQAKVLHEIRFLGNDAAHELDQPRADIVATALDIVDHILEQVYAQPSKGKELAARKKPERTKAIIEDTQGPVKDVAKGEKTQKLNPKGK